MKRTFAILVILSSCLSAAHSQTMSHEEEVVRNAYAKPTFMSGIWPLTKTLITPRSAPFDPVKFNQDLAQEAPVFTLSNFQIGPIADITNQPWNDFAPPRPRGTRVLNVVWYTHSYAYEGQNARWSMPRLSWGPGDSQSTDAHVATVGQVIKQDSHNWGGPVTYTRYAAFTVDLTYEGISTGPYKALFLFGTDAHGKDTAPAMLDPIVGNALFNVVVQPSYPAGLLQTKMREMPQVADWIRTNEVSASSCSTTHEVCCSHGHCGLSQTDVNHDLSLPTPQERGGQQ